MADKGNITNSGKGQTPFTATYGEEKESFGTFAEAQRWLDEQTGEQEPAASEMTPADAEEINSDVVAPVHPGAENIESGAGSNLDNVGEESGAGAGNRQAPHLTKTTANDDTNKDRTQDKS